MKRRALLIAGGVAAGAGVAGLLWVRAGNGGADTRIDAALRKIDLLAAGTVSGTGKWAPGQVFAHCAQSIEFSMTGYPAPKPKLFQQTVGSAAFALFSAKGKMAHGLAEPIDGAPPIDASLPVQQGLERLRLAFTSFRDYKGALMPHFAYGPLTRDEYALAHVMHFYNHLDEIRS